MSPRVIAIIVAIVLVIVAGMVLTVKRSAGKHRAQQVEVVVPAKAGTRSIGLPPPRG